MAAKTREPLVEPTIFDAVSPEMTIAREEIFGPVVSFIRYRDEDDAIRIANDSIHGLSGMVFTKDPERGEQIARKVRTGNISINGLQIDPGVQAVEEVRSGVDAERVILVGHSMGTAVVVHYAQLHPQYVAGVILVDGTIFAPETRMLFKDVIANGVGPLESVIGNMLSPSTPPLIQQRVMAMMLNSPETTQRGVLNVLVDPAAPSDSPVKAPTLARVQWPCVNALLSMCG